MPIETEEIKKEKGVAQLAGEIVMGITALVVCAFLIGGFVGLTWLVARKIAGL